MDWQLLAVAAALALAVAYLTRGAWRTWFGRTAKACGSGCGGCPAPRPADEAADRRRIALPQLDQPV